MWQLGVLHNTVRSVCSTLLSYTVHKLRTGVQQLAAPYSGRRATRCTNTRFMLSLPFLRLRSAVQWYSHASTSSPAAATSSDSPSGVKK